MATTKPTLPNTLAALSAIVGEVVAQINAYNKRNPDHPINSAQVEGFLNEVVQPARVEALLGGLRTDLLALVSKGKGPIKWDASFLA